jgi:hypothetical protein
MQSDHHVVRRNGFANRYGVAVGEQRNPFLAILLDEPRRVRGAAARSLSR